MATNIPIINSSAVNEQVIAVEDIKVLLVGTMLPTGTAIPKEIVENVSEEDVNLLFGAGSILADSVREFRAINEKTRVDIFPVASLVEETLKSSEGSKSNKEAKNRNARVSLGSKAFAQIAVRDGSFKDGSFEIIIGKKSFGGAVKNKGFNKAVVNTKSTDTLEDITNKIATQLTQISLDENNLFDIDSVITDNVIKITAKGTGATYNTLTLEVNILKDIGTTIDVNGFNGGGDAITNVYDISYQEFSDALNIQYDMIVWLCNDIDLGILKTYVEENRNIINSSQKSAMGMFSLYGNNVNEIKDLAENYKSDYLYCLAFKKRTLIDSFGTVTTFIANGTPEHIQIVNAAAVISLRATNNANVSSIMVNPSPDAQTGGGINLTIPFWNTKLLNIPYDSKNSFSRRDQNILAENGFSYFDFDDELKITKMGDTPLTGYTAQNQVEANKLMLQIFIEKFFFKNIGLKIQQCGLSDNDAVQLLRNNSIVTKGWIKQRMIELFSRLSGIVDVTEKGKTFFTETLEIKMLIAEKRVDINLGFVLPDGLKYLNLNFTYGTNQ